MSPTPLQEALECDLDCWAMARDRLDDEAWVFFVAIHVERGHREAERLTLGEALRALRESDS